MTYALVEMSIDPDLSHGQLTSYIGYIQAFMSLSGLGSIHQNGYRDVSKPHTTTGMLMETATVESVSMWS